MNKKYIVGVIVIVAGILSLNSLLPDKITIEPAPTPKPSYGALAGPDLPSNYFSFGGVRDWAGFESLLQGSSTICAIQSPAATSTLNHGSLRFAFASSSAISVDLARGTTQYGTSTLIGTTYAVAAGAQATIVASSTGSVAGDATIFPPSTWFIARINQWSASSGVLNAPTGTCQARWTQI